MISMLGEIKGILYRIRRWNVYGNTVEHSYNKPEIPCQTVCYKQDFVISGQFPMRYRSTWLRSLLCCIKKFVIEEFVIRVFHYSYVYRGILLIPQHGG